MDRLTQEQIEQINYLLAKEFIETRLDAEPTVKNIKHLANCIYHIEDHSNTPSANNNKGG